MSEDFSPQWVLLGLLLRKPMHGYELHQSFAAPSPLGQVWHLGMSQMYKLLKELEGQGYVRAIIEEQDARPDKRVYHVTNGGQQALTEWLETPVRGIRLIRVEFLGKLYLAQALGPQVLQKVIDRQQDACEGLLRQLKKREPATGFEDLVLRFRAGQIQAAIDWLAECKETLLHSGAQNVAEST
jgi:PadR family transcriptional regulator AphA